MSAAAAVSAYAAPPPITQPEALKAIQDTETAIQENKKKITENTSTIFSVWKANVDVGIDSKKAKLTVTRSDDNTTSNFTVKGICYSPAPMNSSNKNGPSLGDWYWDTLVNPSNPHDVWAYAWEAIWARDLQNLRNLGVNCIRVYSMLYKQIGLHGEVPTAATYDNLPKFSHRKFLDLCWNNGKDPIYVIVGIPMNPLLFQKNADPAVIKEITYYWEHVLVDTAKDLGTHPAVLGFTVANEVDDYGYAWNPADPNSPNVQYWWSQLQKYAQMVKAVAPNKLVGIANHDFGDVLVKYSTPYMAQCTSLDFWGSNTYQTENFNSVFGTNGLEGYNQLTGTALKPVILTEYGLPATSRTNPSDPFTIYADTATATKTANVIAKVLPNAYTFPLCAGVTYFEYCDEWWKQDQPNGIPAILYKWYGGNSNPGFPNGYWDDEGFGVYTIERAGYDGTNPQVRQLPPYFLWKDPYYNGPYQPDVLTELTPLTDVIKKTYNTVK